MPQQKTFEAAKPSAALGALGKALLGSWRFDGDASGVTRYEWLEGSPFLKQSVDIEVFGKSVKGVEIIGHIHGPGEQASAEIWSRFYSFGDGLTLDYVYELDGDHLTIWFKHKASDNRFTGTIAGDRLSYKGAWAWPGGGYSVTAVRLP